MNKKSESRIIAYAGIFGVLTAVGAYITIPLPAVPVTAQSFFVLLSGILLGPKGGFLSMEIYLLIGAAGFPVFHGGTGGIGILFGPTGGYLIGFLAAAFIVGYVTKKAFDRNTDHILPILVLAAAIGTLAIYVLGVPWLAFVSDFGLTKAMTVGVLPFLAGDAVKAALAISVSETLRSTISFGLGGSI